MINLFKLPFRRGKKKRNNDFPKSDILLSIIRNYTRQNQNLDQKDFRRISGIVMDELENVHHEMNSVNHPTGYDSIVKSFRTIESQLK